MREGDWVITKAMNPLTGKPIKAISYIVEERDDCYITVGAKKYAGIVFVAPKKVKGAVIPMKASLKPEDIDELINLALDLKDEKWFRQLCKLKERVV